VAEDDFYIQSAQMFCQLLGEVHRPVLAASAAE
jgi:hypothetical protein